MSIATLATPEPAPPPGDGWREAIIESDGVYYLDDGEMVFAGTIHTLEVVTFGDVTWARSRSDPFTVDDLVKADWVLERIAESEAQVEAVRLRKRALLANLDRQERQHQRRADWFRSRFGDQVEAVARRELEARGGKRRTLALDHGTVSFRRSQGTTRIVDEVAALEWTRAHAPDAVSRKEWVTATNARRVIDAMKDNGMMTDDPRWIESTGPRETVKIETGLPA